MNRGFTLIELLVTVGILGILASIVISQYSDYKAKAYDVVALSALKDLINAEEAYYVDNSMYIGCRLSGGNAGLYPLECTSILPGLMSVDYPDHLVTVTSPYDGDQAFFASSCSSKGSKLGNIPVTLVRYYIYRSGRGTSGGKISKGNNSINFCR